MGDILVVVVIVIIAGVTIVPRVLSDYRKIMNTISKVDEEMDEIDKVTDKINAIDPDLLRKAYKMIEDLTVDINGLNITALELLLRLPGLMNEFNVSSFSEIPDELNNEDLRDFVTRWVKDDN